MTTRKVLFITYNFPPHGGAGVQRSLKFVKYLPQFGWKPLVIAADPDAGPVQDASLAKDIPAGTRVERIRAFSIYRLIARFRQLRLSPLAVLVNLLLQSPDPARFWASRALPVASMIIQEEHPAAIYSTSGPFSNHLLALWLKQRTGLPWLADFRDPWSTNLLMPYLPGYRALNRQIERHVLTVADRVVCVSQPWLADLQNNLRCQPEKFVTIPNGYDPDDIHPMAPPPLESPFTLTHLGSFYRNRRPEALVAAVQLLIDRGEIPVERLRVRFIGKNARGSLPNQPPFESYDYVPHKDLDHYRAETSVYLLLLNPSPENAGNHSGKIFEYIASNRPILGIVPPNGVAQRLLEETRTGLAVGGEPEEIAAGILHLYQQWQAGMIGWQPDWEVIQQYSRPRLTERLAQELELIAQAVNLK